MPIETGGMHIYFHWNVTREIRDGPLVREGTLVRDGTLVGEGTLVREGTLVGDGTLVGEGTLVCPQGSQPTTDVIEVNGCWV